MAKKTYYYNVKNRSAGAVLYTIPEDNVRRRFAPGETKRISYEELLHLSYQAGGREIMANFLQIQSEGVPKSLGIKTEPEYYMSEDQIVELMKHGTLEAFLDCLDFAPEGVIELIKKFAVTLPLDNQQLLILVKSLMKRKKKKLRKLKKLPQQVVEQQQIIKQSHLRANFQKGGGYD